MLPDPVANPVIYSHFNEITNGIAVIGGRASGAFDSFRPDWRVMALISAHSWWSVVCERIGRFYIILSDHFDVDHHRPQPFAVLQRLQENLVIDWTYNSNAIEGKTLSINETRLVLQDGLTIGRKSLIEHLEAINHRDAIRFIETLARSPEPISERNISEIHAIVLKEIDPKYAGRSVAPRH